MNGQTEARVIISIGGLAIALVMGVSVFALEQGWFAPRTAEQELARLPAMAQIRSAEPAAHAALAAAMVDVLAARRPAELVLWHAAPALRRLLANHAARGADDRALALGRVFLELLDGATQPPGAFCRALLDGGTAEPALDALLPPALARRAAMASLVAIGSGLDQKRPLPSPAQLAPVVERLSERLSRILPPEDFSRLPRLTAAPPDATCRILRAVLRETLALPEHQAAMLLRHGFSRAMGAGE